MTDMATAQRTPAAYHTFDELPIGGRWRHGRGRAANRDLNPWNGETLIDIPQATREDLDEAYAAAADAQMAWAALLPGDRAAVMRRAATVMEARHDEIVGWLIREAGSTMLKATLEWEAVHAVLNEAAALPYAVEGRILPADAPGKESRVYRDA